MVEIASGPTERVWRRLDWPVIPEFGALNAQ